MQTNLITIKEASDWASQYLSREISASNISYLIQYRKIENIKQTIRLLLI